MSKTIFKKTYSKACPAAISPAHNNFPSILRDPWVLAAESVCKYSSHESFTSIPNKVKGLTVYSSSGERHLTESTAHDRMWWESERGSLQATLLPNSSISRSHPENCLAKVSFYLCLWSWMTTWNLDKQNWGALNISKITLPLNRTHSG